jgi:hypothetical protein
VDGEKVIEQKPLALIENMSGGNELKGEKQFLK